MLIIYQILIHFKYLIQKLIQESIINFLELFNLFGAIRPLLSPDLILLCLPLQIDVLNTALNDALLLNLAHMILQQITHSLLLVDLK